MTFDVVCSVFNRQIYIPLLPAELHANRVFIRWQESFSFSIPAVYYAKSGVFVALLAFAAGETELQGYVRVTVIGSVRANLSTDFGESESRARSEDLRIVVREEHDTLKMAVLRSNRPRRSRRRA